jgi:hypothetical protein
MLDQRLDQSEAKPTAAAGDDDIFVFEAHQLAPLSAERLGAAKTMEEREKSQCRPMMRSIPARVRRE